MENDKSLSLSDLFHLFISKLWLMVIAAVIVTTSVGAIRTHTYVPMYESTSSVLVSGTDAEQHQNSSTEIKNWLSIAMTIVDECREVVTSRRVLDPVVEELELDRYDIDYNDLKKMVSVSSIENTRMIYVTVTASDPTLASDVVNSVCKHAQKVIVEMKMGEATILDEGIVNNNPINSNGGLISVACGIAAAAVVYIIFFITTVLNKKIITAEHVKEYTGLPVLGDISFNSASKGKKSKYVKTSK